ncbi:MAG TPA: cupredoxin domain-containing protein [Nitrospirales bacterium]|jgi:uncharacterized cupredoxin-like copper-binding protein
MRLQIVGAALLGISVLSCFESDVNADSILPVVKIAARQRVFIPEVVFLKMGHPVALVIENEDVELHAFVPLLLFQGLNVQVTGNGAPEFNETGLARVLIPPKGHANIRFTPRAAGHFFYICDLPGHQMRGEIIVTADSL